MVRVGDAPQWAGLSLLTALGARFPGAVDCLGALGGLSVAIWRSGVSGSCQRGFRSRRRCRPRALSLFPFARCSLPA